jgi:hypothetical protein
MRPAALVFLADQSDDGFIDAAYKKLLQSLWQHAIEEAFARGTDVDDAVERAKERLCVVFRRDHSYHVWPPSGTNYFDKAPEQSPVDILRED